MARRNAPSRAELLALRNEGMTRDEMAAHYKVSLSVVKDWIRDAKLPPPREGELVANTSLTVAFTYCGPYQRTAHANEGAISCPGRGLGRNRRQGLVAPVCYAGALCTMGKDLLL